MIYKHFQEYERLKAKGVLAITMLCEINHFILRCDANEQSKEHWLNLVKDEFTKNFDCNEIVSKIQQDYKKIKKIISVGEDFNEDEFLLILTLRIEMDLKKEFCDQMKVGISFPDCDSLDEEIILLPRKTQNNKKEYERAISLMKKNWGFLIQTKWF